MTLNASAIASETDELPYRRGYAHIALHAARHITCSAHSALRTLLVEQLLDDGHPREVANQHADDLIEIATGVLASLDAGETRKTPWPGGQHAAEYAQAMYELESRR